MHVINQRRWLQTVRHTIQAIASCGSVFRLGLAITITLLPSVASSLADEVVYDNTSTPFHSFFAPNDEYGDEVVLESTNGVIQSCTLTRMTFLFTAISFTGTEKATVRLYLNDGPNFIPGAPEPNTVLYQKDIQFPAYPNGDATYSFDLHVPNTPPHFTWTIQFADLPDNVLGGLNIFSPPIIGKNYDDYWENTTNGWQLRMVQGVPMSFGAKFEATDIRLVGETNQPAQPTLPLAIEWSSRNSTVGGITVLPESNNTRVEVDASTNLKDWQAVTNFNAGFLPQHLEIASTTQPVRFYRAKAQLSETPNQLTLQGEQPTPQGLKLHIVSPAITLTVESSPNLTQWTLVKSWQTPSVGESDLVVPFDGGGVRFYRLKKMANNP